MVALDPSLYNRLKQLAENNFRPLRLQLKMIVDEALKKAGL